MCACGTADEASCEYARAAPGTCLGDNPAGAEWMYGVDGWVTCLEAVCYFSCDGEPL
jgi:hypothetical protein